MAAGNEQSTHGPQLERLKYNSAASSHPPHQFIMPARSHSKRDILASSLDSKPSDASVKKRKQGLSGTEPRGGMDDVGGFRAQLRCAPAPRYTMPAPVIHPTPSPLQQRGVMFVFCQWLSDRTKIMLRTHSIRLQDICIMDGDKLHTDPSLLKSAIRPFLSKPPGEEVPAQFFSWAPPI